MGPVSDISVALGAFAQGAHTLLSFVGERLLKEHPYFLDGVPCHRIVVFHTMA